MKTHGLVVLAFATACIALPLTVSAEPLSLPAAVSKSLAYNPLLGAASADTDAARAQAEREGMAPQFTLTGEVENVAGTGDMRGTRSAEMTLRLERVIELGGKQRARQALGSAQVARQENLLAVEQINIASLATTRFVAVAAAQKRVLITEERVTLAQQTRAEVARWVSAARNPVSDLHAADIALADAKLAHEKARRTLKTERMALAATWGDKTDAFGEVIGELMALPPIGPFDVLAARLESTPMMRENELETQAIQAGRRVALSSAAPDLTVSLGGRRLFENSDNALVMSVSVPLGSKPRARLAVAQADAQLLAARSRQAALRNDAHQLLFSLYQELVLSKEEFEFLTTDMIPKAEKGFVFSRKGYAAGRFSFLSVSQAQSTLFDLKERSIDAAARYHSLLAEIKRLTAISTGESS